MIGSMENTFNATSTSVPITGHVGHAHLENLRHRALFNGASRLVYFWAKHDYACLCANPDTPTPLSTAGLLLGLYYGFLHSLRWALNPKPLNPKPLNPKSLNLKPLNPQPLLLPQSALEPLGIKALKWRQLTLSACHPSRL